MASNLDQLFTDPNLLDVFIEAESLAGYLHPPIPFETAQEFRRRLFSTIEATQGRTQFNQQGLAAGNIEMMRQSNSLAWRVLTAARLIGYNQPDLMLQDSETEAQRYERLTLTLNQHPRATQLGIKI